MIVEYKVLAHHNEQALADLVNQYLNQGWLLHYGPSGAGNNLVQAVVREEVPPTNIPDKAA